MTCHFASQQLFVEVVYITFLLLLPTECKRGKYMKNKICTKCPIGTYMNRSNTADSCEECEDGKTTRKRGSTGRFDCIGKLP